MIASDVDFTPLYAGDIVTVIAGANAGIRGTVQKRGSNLVSVNSDGRSVPVIPQQVRLVERAPRILTQ
jgi:ribosomal protein L24